MSSNATCSLLAGLSSLTNSFMNSGTSAARADDPQKVSADRSAAKALDWSEVDSKLNFIWCSLIHFVKHCQQLLVQSFNFGVHIVQHLEAISNELYSF